MQRKILTFLDRINFLERFSIILFSNRGSLTAISVPKRVEKSCHPETSNESINKNNRLKIIKLAKKAVRLMLIPTILRRILKNIIDENKRKLQTPLINKGGVNTRKIL